MQIRNLRLSLDALSHGGPVILKDVAPDHEYDADNRRTDKVIGLRATVVFPGNGYDTQTVKVADPTDRLSVLLDKATPAHPVYVDFDGFTASVYTMRDADGRWRTGVSAKATAVRAVSGPGDDLFDLETDA